MNLSSILHALTFTTIVALSKADDDWSGDWNDDQFSADQFSKFNATVLFSDVSYGFCVAFLRYSL